MEENSDFQSDESIDSFIDLDDDSLENDNTLLNNSCDNMSATSSPLTLSQFSFHDELQMLVIDDDDDDDRHRNDDDDDRGSFLSDISSISSSGSTEIKKTQNESISMLEQKIMENYNNDDDYEIEISDQQVPTKNIENFKSSLIFDKIEKTPFFSTSSVKPTSVELNYESSTDDMDYNESFLNSKIESSNDSNIQTSKNVYMISHNNVDYVVDTSDLDNKSLPKLFSSESDEPTIQSIPPTSKVTQNVRRKRVSKSIPQMQKLPNGKYKMVSFRESVLSANNNETFQNRKSILNSHQLKHFQQNKQVSPRKFSQDKSTNSDNVNKKNNSHTATSKAFIKNHSLMPSEDCGIKINEYQEKSLVQSDDLTLSNIKRHG